jgi:glucose/galactose transporter
MTSSPSPANTAKNYLLPMIIISALFFIFGFVTWLNGILIPYLKIACELTNFQALLVAFAFYIAYTIMALPSAWVLERTGLKNGMMIGLFVMAVGTLIFLPAAYTRTYWVFLLGLFIMGTGLAVLQTASNPYITIIGPRESAARRISILGICNKLAGAIAPLILVYYIFNDGDAFIKSLEGLDAGARSLALDGLATRVVGPYIIMTIILVLMGVGIRLSPLPEIKKEQDADINENLVKTKQSIFGFPHLILGAIALFFYVGAEVIAGDTIIRYGQSLDVAMVSAKNFTSLTLFGMIIGYICGIALIPKYLSQANALKICAVLGIVFSLGAILVPAQMVFTIPFFDIVNLESLELVLPLTILFVALLGFANALVWPAIWPLAIHNLGSFINQGSALLIMAISGGAILPLIWGKIVDIDPTKQAYWSQQAYWIMIPCYLMILFYAVKGYKLTSWKK